MGDLDYSRFFLLASVAGIASHLAYFIHGEHHMQSLQYLLAIVFSPSISFIAILSSSITSSYITALKLTAVIFVSFFTSLISSILVYRIFFHPLRHFSGPFCAKASKLTHVWRLIGTSDNYLQVHELHERFGEIVR